ncbi:RTA1-like protein [Agrocybe pediades]|nr:RTA1-like protein [Agrocybe pediades]
MTSFIHFLVAASPGLDSRAEHHNFSSSLYNYIPTKWIAIMFIVLFGVTSLLHAAQASYYRMWWLFPTICLCGILEIIGWSGRLWSRFNPPNPQPSEMQITGTILGPTPFLAANFVIFGIIIQRLGTQFSRLSPKWYTILFCTCDVVSLVIQGVGGGKAAVAADNGEDPTPGGRVMLGGISFQLVTISIYALCALEYYIRYFLNKPIHDITLPPQRAPLTKKLTIMSGALLFSTTCLFIRAIYRLIELSDGWDGRIISTQVYFNILDATMIVLTMYTLNFLHPGLLLGAGSGLNHGTLFTKKPTDKNIDA